MKNYIVLDVGGTTIKGNMISNGSFVYDKHIVVDSHAKESKEVIIDNFIGLISKINKNNQKIDAICFAFPGPFDYERGISYMKGIGKYDAIYSLSIEAEIKKNAESPWIKDSLFIFLHDIEAFAWGVISSKTVFEKTKAICLCIGTGAGSAFIENGCVVKSGKGVPENGWIYSTKFKDSIIDDYISVRGFDRLCSNIYGESVDGYMLQKKAESGEEKALEVFKAFGSDIADAIESFIKEFVPDYLVIGGNLGKGYPLFKSSLDNLINKYGIEVLLETDTSKLIFLGLAFYLEKRGENGKKA